MNTNPVPSERSPQALGFGSDSNLSLDFLFVHQFASFRMLSSIILKHIEYGPPRFRDINGFASYLIDLSYACSSTKAHSL